MSILQINLKLAEIDGMIITEVINEEVVYGYKKRVGVLNTVGMLDYTENINLLFSLLEDKLGKESKEILIKQVITAILKQDSIEGQNL